MYERQEPSPQLMQEHIRQMRDTLALINALIYQTPYAPNAPWVARVPLDDAGRERARNSTPDPACRESFVCVYETHVRQVLAEAAPRVPDPVANAPAPKLPGQYSSLHEALSEVHPALAQGQDQGEALHQQIAALDEQYRQLSGTSERDPEALEKNQKARAELVARLDKLRADLGRPPSAADLRDPTKAQIVRDALVVTSVALRLALEASSLATVIALEARDLAGQNVNSWLKSAPDSTRVASELPQDVRAVYQELEKSAEGLDALVQQLAALEQVDPLQTAGYQFEDGLVDEIVGFGWDSIHVDFQAGGNALFYSSLSDAEFSTSDDGTTYDYTGRFTKLEYDVEPIVLVSGQLSVKADWPHWAEAMGLNLGYATNRMYKSGGEIESGSLADELGVSNTFSDALDAALAVAGVNAGVKIAHFTHGTVRDILIEDDTVLAEAPFQFDMKQIDVGYDLAPRHHPTFQKLTVGFRYFDYSLPRILYELVNLTPDQENATYVFSRETPPQSIRTQYYMLALTGGFEHWVTEHFAPYLSLDVAFGYGPTEYYFLKDDTLANTEDNREYFKSNGPGVGVAGALGFRWHLGGPGASPNAYFDAHYHAQFLQGILDAKDEGDTIVKVGTSDVFHGPTAALGMTF